MIQLCLVRLLHIASVIGAWEAGFVAAHVNSIQFKIICIALLKNEIRGLAIITLSMWTLSFADTGVNKICSTDTCDVKKVLKTFNTAFMLLLNQKEQHKRSFQPHIIISVLETFSMISMECVDASHL